jgi:hypothetical protein
MVVFAVSVFVAILTLGVVIASGLVSRRFDGVVMTGVSGMDVAWFAAMALVWGGMDEAE